MHIHLGAVVKILAKMINIMRGATGIDHKMQPAVKPRHKKAALVCADSEKGLCRARTAA